MIFFKAQISVIEVCAFLWGGGKNIMIRINHGFSRIELEVARKLYNLLNYGTLRVDRRIARTLEYKNAVEAIALRLRNTPII